MIDINIGAGIILTDILDLANVCDRVLIKYLILKYQVTKRNRRNIVNITIRLLKAASNTSYKEALAYL